MAAADYDQCLARLLVHEGGYTNNAADPGGPTNFGITITDYRHYVKPNATAADVRAMPLSDAKAIYRPKYWNVVCGDDLPAGVDDSTFDYGVNSGNGRADKVLRHILGLSDTAPNADVIAAITKVDPKVVIVAMNDERLKFLQSLHTWPVFGKGWEQRVAEVKAYSLQLAAGVKPALPAPSIAVQQAGKGILPAVTSPPTAPESVGIFCSPLFSNLLKGI